MQNGRLRRTMKWPQLRADRYVWEDVSKVAGIKDAVGQGLSKLPFFDPFEDIDTICQSADRWFVWYIWVSKYVGEHGIESGSNEYCDEWVEENEQDGRSIFKTSDDEEDLWFCH